ncbi:uncharacterized protein K444DRAFT_413145 [Hyaloscypha bicolor E]|uniref:Uncharacterized protein n=1 Tax=Hyaloscypha bicolor E TaxID=1095630 RepID=A0A2J6T6D3_9HELO|nr:uncharacterized protein K444DRAFT_413145 [Hyaloscypha bicolor E]PMD58569.1 hypothetical protein K444DRAFT_413145 [Hyaloscypha bicolor E]
MEGTLSSPALLQILVLLPSASSPPSNHLLRVKMLFPRRSPSIIKRSIALRPALALLPLLSFNHVHALDCSLGTYLMSNQQDATSLGQCVNDGFFHNVTIAPSATGDISSINLGEASWYIIAENSPLPAGPDFKSDGRVDRILHRNLSAFLTLSTPDMKDLVFLIELDLNLKDLSSLEIITMSQSYRMQGNTPSANTDGKKSPSRGIRCSTWAGALAELELELAECQCKYHDPRLAVR